MARLAMSRRRQRRLGRVGRGARLLWPICGRRSLDASASLVLTGVFMAYIWWRVDIGRSEMVKFFPASAKGVLWDLWLLNATGWAAMLWAWRTTILGLLVAGGRPKWLPGSTRTIEKLHRTTSLSTIALTLIHILVLVEHEFRHKDQSP